MTGDGLLVDGGITIPSDVAESSIMVGTDGTVSATQNGQLVNIGQIQLVRFANPAGLNSGGGNLFEATPASGQEILGLPGTDGLGARFDKDFWSDRMCRS